MNSEANGYKAQDASYYKLEALYQVGSSRRERRLRTPSACKNTCRHLKIDAELLAGGGNSMDTNRKWHQ
jgi:hypothetical protein